MLDRPISARTRAPLYTAEQRVRRDKSRWTLVQGVLAPVQFLVFLFSLALVIRYLTTGAGLELATASIVLKTLVLYTIMITGAIWEKVVFGKYLFADAFFWEDAFSMIVIALHTFYLVLLLGGIGSPALQLPVPLAGHAPSLIPPSPFTPKPLLPRPDTTHIKKAASYAN